MGWSRFDDNWTEKIRAMDLDFQTRWHYMAMIQFCSRTNKWDGCLKAVDARTISDVDDPDGCLAELMEHGLVTRDVTRDKNRDVTRYRVVHIEEHILPPHLRDTKRKDAQTARQHRSRGHRAGDHSLCLPGKCPDVPGEATVTRDVGTGQDGHGLEELPPTENRDEIDPWATPSPPEQVLDLRPSPAAGCSWCRNSVVPGCPNCETTMSEVG